MNWTAAIERNRDALKRIVSSLVDIAALGAGKPTVPRHLHRTIVSLLRPAEAATRRLIITLARGLVVKLPPPRAPKPAPKSSFAKNNKSTGIILPRGFVMPPPPPPEPVLGPAFGRTRGAVPLPRFAGEDLTSRPASPSDLPPFTGKGDHAKRGEGGGNTQTRKVSFSLLDPLRRSCNRPKRSIGVPRISTPGLSILFPITPRKPPSPDGSVSATRLNLRLTALTAALDDMPRQALRFARWKARSDALMADIQRQAEAAQNGRRIAVDTSQRRSRRLWPLRPGRPPGCRLRRWDPDAPRLRRIREVDEILAHAHELALVALGVFDTS